MLRDVDMMACLGNFLTVDCLLSSTGMSQVMKRSGRCGRGGFVVIHWKSSNTVDGS